MMLASRRSTKNCNAFLAGTPIYTQWGHISQYFYHPANHVFERRVSPATKISTPCVSWTARPHPFLILFCKEGHPRSDVKLHFRWYSERCSKIPLVLDAEINLSSEKCGTPEVPCVIKKKKLSRRLPCDDDRVDMKAESTRDDISIVDPRCIPKTEMNEGTVLLLLF